MAGWLGSGWMRARWLAVLAAAALLAGLGGIPAQAAAAPAGGHAHGRPPLPAITAPTGVGRLGVREARHPRVAEYRPVHTSWPVPAQATIKLTAAAGPLTRAGEAAARRSLVSAGTQTAGAGTPVWAQALPAAAGAARVTGVGVRVLGHAAAVAAGVRGVVFTAQASPASPGGPVRLGLSYAGFAQASGGNYGLGLGLARLPGCALTTPQRPGCRAGKPLAFVNDSAAQDVSAPVTLPGRPAGSAAGGRVVLAATPMADDGGGAGGTYSATSLRASGTWSEGGSTGSFTYSYPLPVPPAAGGLVPQLSLDYDSGTVDGQTAATQAQASWVGDGWTLPQSFIEQSFIPCADNPEGSASPKSTQDECYNGPVLMLSQDGTSTPLVCPPSSFSYTSTSTCQAADDTGEVITHHVQSSNGSGTKFTDYWTITERDGTTFYFGRNHLPGWASGDPAANSVDSVPVFSAHSGDPCYSSSGFGSSVCTMAYRWNLDYVTDLHGNAMAYYYQRDTNAYAENGGTSSATSYIRDSHLDHVDYGFTDGNAYTGHAADQVQFGSGDRCFTGTCDPIGSNASNWPDVPYTQDHCTLGGSCQVTGPTFWSTVSLASVTTQQWNGTKYVPADSWSLAYKFPATGDGTSPALWLNSITRTGSDTSTGGTAVPLPKVAFTPVQLANRLNPGNYPALVRERIGQITTETGAVISVTYEQPNQCDPNKLPTPEQNNQSCFPVYWQQFAPPPSGIGADWFVKYAVQSVSVSDPTGGSNGLYTSYTYSGAAWHYDDNELVMPKYRTYGQWRGYQDVKTFTGTGNDAPTKSETTYYQGMSDDNNSTAVTLTDSQGGQHDDTNQLAGDPLETTVYNFKGGPVDHSTIDSYWVSAPAASRARSGLPDLTANATGLVEEWSRQAITDTATTTWRKTETDTSYDATPSDNFFGLPLIVFSHGDLADPTQQTCTTTTYAPANTGENLIGLPAEVETDAAACGGSSPGGASAPGPGQVNALTAPAGLSRPADVISDKRTFYDNPALAQTWPQPASPAWPQATPTVGDVSVVRAAKGYPSGAFTYQTKAATVYDSYGRPVDSYDANGNLTTTGYTMTGGSTTAQTVTNPLGQATTTALDPVRGIPATVTDANGNVTYLQYDGLGRLTDVWDHGRNPTDDPATANEQYAYQVTNSQPYQPAVVTAKQLNDELGYITSTTLYDALLRVRQTQYPAPNGGMLVNDNFYDSRGWLDKINTNWWDSGASPGTSVVTVPDSQVPDQTVTAFDGLGRPVLVTTYDDAAVKSTAATAYYGDRVTTVPPTGGTPTATVTDALGRTTELDSYTTAPTVNTSTASGITTVTITGGTTQATDYAYNHRGWPSAITDAATGEQWSRGYNLLGQVTSATTPNSGTTSMSYDPNGNLTGTTDANNHSLTWTYDALNRKTGEFDGTSTSAPQLASWGYDNANNAVANMTDPVGHLTTETSYSGGHAYIIQQAGFNSFGESTGETITLPGAEGALAGSYTLSHTYSTATGLPVQDTYPASPGGAALPGETVTHGYETGFDLPGGLGSTLGAYGQQITYTQFFQVAQEEVGSLANNAYVTNTYDPHTGNLTDTQVQNTTVQPSAPYDDTGYTYDPYGNLTVQGDTRVSNGVTKAETQCYGYDTLDRLTQAWTGTDNCAANPSSNGGATVGDGISGGAYWTSWAFDPLGDWTKQTQHSLTGGQNTVTNYTYNGNGASQPNTLTSTSTTSPSGPSSASYGYDADGNTSTRNLPAGNQALTWTDNGKLATDATSSGTTSYIYDADGNLLLQKDPGQTTLYLFGGAEQIFNTGGTITGTRFISLPGGGTVVRTGAGTNYTFEFTDQHHTSLLTLDNTAAHPAWRQFTPYGVPRGQAPASWPDSNGFLGKPTDATTALTTVGARQYDPATGRFLSPDPILDTAAPQTMAGYTYAAGNPTTKADPTGLCPQFPGCNGVPQPGPPGHRHPSPPLIPCGQPGGQPCQGSAPVSQGFGSGVPAHAHAATWAIYTSDLLAAESQFQQKYGYIPTDLTACTAGPDGGAPACGGKDLLDVLTFLSGYLCAQPGIACTGAAATQSPLQAAISLAGGMILGAGRDGGITSVGGGSAEEGGQYGPFHRLASTSQTPENLRDSIDTGTLKGRPSSWYWSREGIVQAFRGPLPEDAPPGSFEFTTPVEPYPVNRTVSGQAWWPASWPGVGSEDGGDTALIPINITRIKPYE